MAYVFFTTKPTGREESALVPSFSDVQVLRAKHCHSHTEHILMQRKGLGQLALFLKDQGNAAAKQS